MSELLVFVGGKGAPSGLVVGRVYEMRLRGGGHSFSEFSWWKHAPEGTKVGDNVLIKGHGDRGEAIVTGDAYKSVEVDRSIPFDFDPAHVVSMRFVGGPGAPSGIPDGEVKKLPLRYARFPWWKVAEEIPKDWRVPVSGPLDVKADAEKGKRFDEAFEKELLNRKIESQTEARPDLEDLGSLEKLVKKEPEAPLKEDPPLETLTVKDLREIAKSMGASPSGLKVELIENIRKFRRAISEEKSSSASPG